MTYYMRGAVSYTEAMNMSHVERHQFTSFLEQRLDAESKNPHPVY